MAKPLTISGARVIPTFRVPRVALRQEHLSPPGGPTLRSQPSDGIRYTILALARTQIPHALRHTLHIPRSTRPERLIRPIRRFQIRQHIIPAGQRVGGQPHRRPTFPQDQRLVLRPQERGIIILNETTVELQGGAAGVGAEGAKLGDGGGDAAGAVGGGEVAAALEEAVERGVLRGGGRDGEVIVGGEHGGVDQGGEEGVDAGLVGRPRRELRLRAAAKDEGLCGG